MLRKVTAFLFLLSGVYCLVGFPAITAKSLSRTELHRIRGGEVYPNSCCSTSNSCSSCMEEECDSEDSMLCANDWFIECDATHQKYCSMGTYSCISEGELHNCHTAKRCAWDVDTGKCVPNTTTSASAQAYTDCSPACS